jgi:hypothetical protein
MDENIVEQILDELFSSFEKSETESAAILLFLKNQGIATEEKLAPCLEQASRISEVRWRAAKVRMGALLASAMKTPDPAPQKKTVPIQDQEKEHPKEEKKEPEKNVRPKAGVEPEPRSEQAAKEKSEGAHEHAPGESTMPVTAETESAQKNSDHRTNDKAAVLQKPTKS